jgi:hypothetical protein
MDGLSCSKWRRAELFQQVADVRLKPTAHNSVADMKLIVALFPVKQRKVCAQAVIVLLFVFTVVNVEQMQASIEILTLTFTISKGRDRASVTDKLFLL